MINAKLFPSLVPIMPENEPEGEELKKCLICKNQPFSFQMAFKTENLAVQSVNFNVRITTELPISYYYINGVPVIHTHYANNKPILPIGIYPDILLPKKVNPKLVSKSTPNGYQFFEKGEQTTLIAFNDSWQGIWFTVNEDSKNIKPGNYDIKIELFSASGKYLNKCELKVEVLSYKLPEQKLMYTNWFHNDCLVDYYGVELFSDRYFEIFADYVTKAVKNGMNMILTPAFTPALDTPIGEERMTVQLVGVKLIEGKYLFDFSLMKKYIDICKKCGITYFEHSHFFTQWGAKHAPKIIAEVDGKQKRIFGWETKATGKKYVEFLNAYIPQLLSFLEKEGLKGKMLFHVSDEPEEKDIETYSAASAIVRELLKDQMVGDALSLYKFYEAGYCKTPIASTHSIHDFIGRCDNLWAYYIGWDCQDGLSNRLHQVSRERNRMLGVQLYYNNIKGFLQWGYNNYYGFMSQYLYNPALNPCGGYAGAGSAFIVYPAPNGTAYQSVRQKIFAEGLLDIRALQLLEALEGRKKCDKIIEKHFGKVKFRQAPESPEAYLNFIDDVYKNIKRSAK